MRWGRFTLDLFHNPGHTMSTLGVDVAEEKLLFSGDTVVGNIVYLAYSAPPLLAAALDRLERRGRPRLVASHGGVVDANVIAHARHYLGRVCELAAPGLPLETCLPDGVPASDFERIFHGRNLEFLA